MTGDELLLDVADRDTLDEGYGVLIRNLLAERDQLQQRLRDEASSFCRAHAEAVQRTNELRIVYDAAVRYATEAHEILMDQMKGRDPERRQLMRVLERLQRVMRGKP